MNDELDESRAVAELVAASIIDRLYPEIVKMIVDALMQEVTENQIKQIQGFLKRKPKSQLLEKTSLDYIKELSTSNPSANEEELRKMFYKLPHNLEKTQENREQSFRRAFYKFAGIK